MEDLAAKLREDYNEVLKARDGWFNAQRALARAEDSLRFAEAKLAVARDQLRLDAEMTEEVGREGQSIGLLLTELWPDDYEETGPEGEETNPDVILRTIAYMGLPTGDACRRALEDIAKLAVVLDTILEDETEVPLKGGGTTEELVQWLISGGFNFSTDAPAREVHGALVKQPWAIRDKDTGRWRLTGRRKAR